jgi:hypothetical protein
MDIQLYIDNLRGQNEYLGQLSTEIETKLQEIDTLFGQQHDPQIFETIAQLHRCLCVEAETFCKRLNLLLEEGRPTKAPLPPEVTA